MIQTRSMHTKKILCVSVNDSHNIFIFSACLILKCHENKSFVLTKLILLLSSQDVKCQRTFKIVKKKFRAELRQCKFDEIALLYSQLLSFFSLSVPKPSAIACENVISSVSFIFQCNASHYTSKE